MEVENNDITVKVLDATTSMATEAGTTLSNTVLGAAVVLLIFLVFLVIYLSHRQQSKMAENQNKSDDRWAKAVENQTLANRQTAEVNAVNGDKIAKTINDALVGIVASSSNGVSPQSLSKAKSDD